ncbi:MAG: transposase, partial [Oscillospiraceae bacterium]|nr:transposase [Oscillospiraceae bacterium]
RRYFVNALPKEKKAHPSSVAAEAVRYCDRIYHKEGLLANMTAEERCKERLVKIKPLLDGLFARLETVQYLKSCSLSLPGQSACHSILDTLRQGTVLTVPCLRRLPS